MFKLKWLIVLIAFSLSLGFSDRIWGGEDSGSSGSSTTTSTATSSEPQNTKDQIGLTYIPPNDLGPLNMLNPNWTPPTLSETLYYEVGGMLGGIGEAEAEAANSFVNALANFPSYQFDSRQAPTPVPQGF